MCLLKRFLNFFIFQRKNIRILKNIFDLGKVSEGLRNHSDTTSISWVGIWDPLCLLKRIWAGKLLPVGSMLDLEVLCRD